MSHLRGSARHAFAWILALGVLGASVSPCPRPATAHEPAHADCHRPAAERFFEAACPCGCADGSASPVARLDPVLPGSIASTDPAQAAAPPTPAAPAAPRAPHRAIDHVPRIA